MKSEVVNISGKTCYLYTRPDAKFLLIQPVDEHDLELLDQELRGKGYGQRILTQLIERYKGQTCVLGHGESDASLRKQQPAETSSAILSP